MSKHLDVRTLDAAQPYAPPTATDLDKTERYILRWARNPDPGSIFAKMTWALVWLPDVWLLFWLRQMGYGGHILLKDGEPIGHVFYQRHGNEIHMFSIAVNDDFRGKGYANVLLRSFLDEMGKRNEIQFLRLSAGGDEAVRHMWLKTLRGEYDLNYEVTSCSKPGLGWVRIVR